MDFNLSKSDRAMIRAAGYGLDGPGVENLEAAVAARIDRLIAGGTVKRALINRNHIAAAITAELARGK